MLVRRRAAPPSSPLRQESTPREDLSSAGSEFETSEVGWRRRRRGRGREEMGEERDRTRGIPPRRGGGKGGKVARNRFSTTTSRTVSVRRGGGRGSGDGGSVAAPLVADEQIRVMGGRNIDLG